MYVLTTLTEALQYPDQDMWINAIKVEINKLFCNKIFKANFFPKRQQPITAKFVFDVKYKKNRIVLKYKACLVAREFA